MLLSKPEFHNVIEDIIPDLVERIKEEVIGAQAYVNVWRGGTTIQKKDEENVKETLKAGLLEMMQFFLNPFSFVWEMGTFLDTFHTCKSHV